MFVFNSCMTCKYCYLTGRQHGINGGFKEITFILFYTVLVHLLKVLTYVTLFFTTVF